MLTAFQIYSWPLICTLWMPTAVIWSVHKVFQMYRTLTLTILFPSWWSRERERDHSCIAVLSKLRIWNPAIDPYSLPTTYPPSALYHFFFQLGVTICIHSFIHYWEREKASASIGFLFCFCIFSFLKKLFKTVVLAGIQLGPVTVESNTFVRPVVL